MGARSKMREKGKADGEKGFREPDMSGRDGKEGIWGVGVVGEKGAVGI